MPNQDSSSSQQEPLLYSPLSEENNDSQYLYDNDKHFLHNRRQRNGKHHLFFLLAATTVAAAAIYVVAVLRQRLSVVQPQCQSPVVRQEWRQLSNAGKQEYLDAVLCLTKTPSVTSGNQTLFDDFSRVHHHVGTDAHASASFLAWHRYFIHVYEKWLREECSYTGDMVYFDWTQDYLDLSRAPIWDPILGFGGDGNLTGGRTVNWGRCVVDGPFAGLSVQYYGDEYKPHCLSRGFQQAEDMTKYYSDRIRPDVLHELMSTEDYESFNVGMENGPHLAIPHGVLGDFLKDTAPYDPVFFLHHTQLDRLWWQWQQINHGTRLSEYAGARSRGSEIPASLSDLMEMGALAPPLAVREVMDTQSGILCYQY